MSEQIFKSGFTLERLQALEEAIAKGEQRVKYSDKEIEYRSIEEMLKVRDLMRRNLGLKTVSRRHKGLFGGVRLKPTHSKGLLKGLDTDANDSSVFGEFDDEIDEK